MQRPIAATEKKITLQEKIHLLKLELAILIELQNILKDKRLIDEAVETRSAIKISLSNRKKIPVKLSAINNVFNAQGELNHSNNKITFELTRVNQHTMQQFGVASAIAAAWSTREMILFDAVIFQAAHTVFEQELCQTEEVNPALNNQVEQACYNILNKIKCLRLTAPDSYEITLDSQTELHARELYYSSKLSLKKSLYDLASRILLLSDFYNRHPSKSESHQCLALKSFVEQTEARCDISVKKKFSLILDALESLFKNNLLTQLQPTCFSALFQSPHIDSVITQLNNKYADYHLLRLTGLILQATYLEYPHLAQPTDHLVNKCISELHTPMQQQYRTFLYGLYENNTRFQQFKTILKNTGISPIDILNFYNNKITLTRHTIKSLWPELKICRLEDAVIDKLLMGVNDVVEMEKLMDSINMAAIYSAKAELMDTQKKQDLFITVPLRKLENRRAFREHLKAINLAIAMIKARQMELNPLSLQPVLQA